MARLRRVAVVDCGTNTVRLLVARETGRGEEPLHAVDRQMRITRLGKGVDACGRLDDRALAHTLDVIEGYAAAWRAHGAERVLIAATSAVRDAADRDRFLDAVAERVGVRAVLLSGEDEARAAFRGATATVPEPGPYLVLDIGGGSTEFIVGDRDVEAWTSQQVGSVRLTERCLGDDPPTGEQMTEAVGVIDDHLGEVAGSVEVGRAGTLIGVAGTVTTLAALHLRLDDYDREAVHRSNLPRRAVRRLCEELAARPAATRPELGPIAPGREDVIVAGALILRRVMERFDFEQAVVSEADILDGLALELLDA